MVPGQTIRAEKYVAADEDYFADHFPGFPVVPGVLLTEMMAQAAGKCLNAPAEGNTLRAATDVGCGFSQPQSGVEGEAHPALLDEGATRAPLMGKAMLAQITSARFLRWVRPNSRILIHARIKTSQPAVATASCFVEVENSVVARAELLFSFVAHDQFAVDYRDAVLEDYLKRSAEGVP
jgi:3-hydroxyacyl-[acyl-carrier-protein] dehydratase